LAHTHPNNSPLLSGKDLMVARGYCTTDDLDQMILIICVAGAGGFGMRSPELAGWIVHRADGWVCEPLLIHTADSWRIR
jgi:hypothetical protein